MSIPQTTSFTIWAFSLVLVAQQHMGYISFTHKDAPPHIPLHWPFAGAIEAFVVRAATADLNESLGSRPTRPVQSHRDIVWRRMLCLGKIRYRFAAQINLLQRETILGFQRLHYSLDAGT